MDNRRLFLAAALSLAVIVLWTYLVPQARPKVPVPHAAGASATASPTSPTPVAPGSPAPETSPTPSSGNGKTALPAWAGQPLQAASEEKVVLEAGSARAVFTNRGAQLLSLEVDDRNPGKSVELVRKRAEGPYPYGLVRKSDLRSHPLNDALFQVERARDGGVVFRYRGPAGVAEKRFHFDDRGFLEAVVTAPGGEWGLVAGPGIRNPTPEELGSRYGVRSAVYKVGGEVKQLSAQRELSSTSVSAPMDWVGLEDNYFLSALIPRAGLDGIVLQPVMIDPGPRGARFLAVPSKDEITSDQKKLSREYRVILKPEGGTLSLTSYWGDKRYERLAALPYHLERSINFGMFGFLARPLLVALHWLHDNVVGNYGWAIILLTVLIKIVLLPLTHTSMKSMRRMQSLNPKVQAIRERYRTKLRDKQGRPNLEVQRKMNDEVMAIYKEAGVNPVGGCLPLLLQMPILFAFFRLLTAAVELRNAPWMLWVVDLSSKDPYFVLPIVMGATQWIQVRMAPQAGDPMQRRIFELMPIFMTVMFIGVPSGLVLYWLTNNVLTILQQAVYKRLEQRTA